MDAAGTNLDKLALLPAFLTTGFIAMAMWLMVSQLKQTYRDHRLAKYGLLPGALGATVLALALRLMLSPCAPYHAEGSAYFFLDSACSDIFLSQAMTFYGHSAPSLYRLVHWFLPFGDITVFGLNLLLGSISAGLVFALTHTLSKDFLEASIAGALFALYPSLIRLSCSEVYVTSLLFWWLVALNVAVRLHENSQWRDWTLLLTSLCLAIHSRPSGLLILGPIGLVLLPLLRKNPKILLGLAIVGLACINPLFYLGERSANYHLSEHQNFISWLLRGFLAGSNQNPTLNPVLTPLLTHPIAQFLGLALLLWRRKFSLFLGLFAFQYALTWVYSSPGIAVALYQTLRLFSTTTPIACILSALAIGSLIRAIPIRSPRFRIALSSTIILGSLAPFAAGYHTLITYEPNLEQEYRVIEKGIERLPVKATVLLPGQKESGGLVTPFGFPRCLAEPQGKKLRVIYDQSEPWRTLAPEEEESFLFIGLNCFMVPINPERFPVEYPASTLDIQWDIQHAPDRPVPAQIENYGRTLITHRTRPDYMSSRCAELFERYELTPLFVREVENRPSQWFSVSPEELRFGFYKIKGSKTPKRKEEKIKH